MSRRYIRIEYSEKQGCFHFEDVNKPNINTNGFYCLIESVLYETAYNFTTIFYKKFNNKSQPLKTVIQEFNLFAKNQ